MIFLAGEIMLYLFGAGVAGGIVAYFQRANRDGDRYVIVTCAALFWPAVTLFFAIAGLVIGVAVGTTHVCTAIGRSVGMRAHKPKITSTTVQMMEEDLARAGGNMDLVLNFDYVPCAYCWGSGCRQCHERGVTREKANR